MRLDRGRGHGVPREDRALFTLPLVPAGDYRIRAELGPAGGWLMAGVGAGRDQFALVTEPVSGVRRRRRCCAFRWTSGRLWCAATRMRAATVSALDVRPLSLRSGPTKVSDGSPGRAVRYGSDERVLHGRPRFPEPAGFWVGGARDTAVVLQPDDARARGCRWWCATGRSTTW